MVSGHRRLPCSGAGAFTAQQQSAVVVFVEAVEDRSGDGQGVSLSVPVMDSPRRMTSSPGASGASNLSSATSASWMISAIFQSTGRSARCAAGWLRAAIPAVVPQFRPAHVERCCTGRAIGGVVGDEAELRGRIDEPPDQPGTTRPVDMHLARVTHCGPVEGDQPGPGRLRRHPLRKPGCTCGRPRPGGGTGCGWVG